MKRAGGYGDPVSVPPHALLGGRRLLTESVPIWAKRVPLRRVVGGCGILFFLMDLSVGIEKC